MLKNTFNSIIDLQKSRFYELVVERMDPAFNSIIDLQSLQEDTGEFLFFPFNSIIDLHVMKIYTKNLEIIIFQFYNRSSESTIQG